MGSNNIYFHWKHNLISLFIYDVNFTGISLFGLHASSLAGEQGRG